MGSTMDRGGKKISNGSAAKTLQGAEARVEVGIRVRVNLFEFKNGSSDSKILYSRRAFSNATTVEAWKRFPHRLSEMSHFDHVIDFGSPSIIVWHDHQSTPMARASLNQTQLHRAIRHDTSDECFGSPKREEIRLTLTTFGTSGRDEETAAEVKEIRETTRSQNKTRRGEMESPRRKRPGGGRGTRVQCRRSAMDRAARVGSRDGAAWLEAERARHSY